MTPEDELQREIVTSLFNIAKVMPPQYFKTFFAGIVANVVGNMSERYWIEFSKIEPCGRAGCDCHLGVQREAQKLFDLLRADHQEHCETTSAE